MGNEPISVEPQSVTKGFCASCNTNHILDNQKARSACYMLMEQLERCKNIALLQPKGPGAASLSTDYLFGDARGKMFGVLIGVDESGKEQALYAFSGQYNGIWSVPGWVDPLFDPKQFESLIFHRERQIKQIGKQLENEAIAEEQRASLKKKRKNISRELMVEIHQLYSCSNFRGSTRSLYDIYLRKGFPPSGTADCCAPKLLHNAALKGLQPLSMAEFYWGRENASSTRQHGHFYPPCESKCEPILGYFLCGANRDE